MFLSEENHENSHSRYATSIKNWTRDLLKQVSSYKDLLGFWFQRRVTNFSRHIAINILCAACVSRWQDCKAKKKIFFFLISKISSQTHFFLWFYLFECTHKFLFAVMRWNTQSWEVKSMNLNDRMTVIDVKKWRALWASYSKLFTSSPDWSTFLSAGKFYI